MKNSDSIVEKDIWEPDFQKTVDEMVKAGYDIKHITPKGRNERYMGETGNNWTGFESYTEKQDLYSVSFQKRTASKSNAGIVMKDVWDSELASTLLEYANKGFNSKHITALGTQLRFLGTKKEQWSSKLEFRNENKFLVVFEKTKSRTTKSK